MPGVLFEVQMKRAAYESQQPGGPLYPANNSQPWAVKVLEGLKPGDRFIFWRGSKEHLDDEIAASNVTPCYQVMLTAIRDCAFRLEREGRITLAVNGAGMVLGAENGRPMQVKIYEHVATGRGEQT